MTSSAPDKDYGILCKLLFSLSPRLFFYIGTMPNAEDRKFERSPSEWYFFIKSVLNAIEI